MASHFSSIGFELADIDDLRGVVDQVSPIAERVPVGRRAYLVWRGSGGEELWLGVDERNDLISCNPHWRGRSQVSFDVRRWHRWDEYPLDGRVVGEIDGEIPIAFDVPDAASHDGVVPAIPASVQVAAFAHELTAWRSEDDFQRSQQDSELRYAVPSLIPTGMFVFGEDDDTDTIPEATAMFTGRVVETGMNSNPLSGRSYLWAEVATLGGTFDVVADPSILEGSEGPTRGGIVQGSFWLSGSWPAPPSRPRRRRFWRRT